MTEGAADGFNVGLQRLVTLPVREVAFQTQGGAAELEALEVDVGDGAGQRPRGQVGVAGHADQPAMRLVGELVGIEVVELGAGNGTIGVDNSINELIVNSHVVTISTGSVSLFESSFTTSSISQYLVSGVNTFDFVVYNTPSSGNASDNGNLTGTNPTGLLINATVTATPSAVPEPSTYALFGAAGTLSLAGLRSLRRRKA